MPACHLLSFFSHDHASEIPEDNENSIMSIKQKQTREKPAQHWEVNLCVPIRISGMEPKGDPNITQRQGVRSDEVSTYYKSRPFLRICVEKILQVKKKGKGKTQEFQEEPS